MNQRKPFVTYYVNTFNRINLLKNLLRSFDACNVYDGPFEWIISDYGSRDGTREFLVDYSNRVNNVTILLSNENDYFKYLDKKGVGLPDKRKKMHSIFGMFRNQIRKISKGDIFVEIADDHQFVRKCDWISEAMSIMAHREEKYNTKDISSIIYRGLSHQRILKKNNKTEAIEITKDGVEYFTAIYKCYDDYHIQHREMYEKIGPYAEVDKIKDKEILDHWLSGVNGVNHYSDYLARTKELGLKKIFMKYPCAIDFPNYTHDNLNKERDDLIVPIFENDEIKSIFSNLDRPVSSDEIFSNRGSL
jgi:hypothetical protein